MGPQESTVSEIRSRGLSTAISSIISSLASGWVRDMANEQETSARKPIGTGGLPRDGFLCIRRMDRSVGLQRERSIGCPDCQ